MEWPGFLANASKEKGGQSRKGKGTKAGITIDVNRPMYENRSGRERVEG
jgi:hypothetical protein